jgi:hypothetical protein
MPKLRTIKYKYKDQNFEANLKVDSHGEFSIDKPGGTQLNTHKRGRKPEFDQITGKTAEMVVALWQKELRELLDKTKVTRKVLIVRFESLLRDEGMKSFFSNRDEMLSLRCLVGEETSITQGDKTTVTLHEHPDYAKFHGLEQPFPFRMCLDSNRTDLNFNKDALTVVDWTPEAEQLLVKACEGIKAVVDMLDGFTKTPESLAAASLMSQLPLLPVPKED